MKKLILTFIFILTFATMSIFGQSYSSLWKEVKSFQSDFKPKSALESVEKIARKAEKEGNFPQFLQASLYRLNLQEDLDPERLGKEADKIESRIATCQNPVDKAIMQVMMANICNGFERLYYSRDADTKETYRKKAHDYLLDALADKAALAEAKTGDFNPLIELTDNSKHFFANDLLSLITAYAATDNHLAKEEQDQVLEDVRLFYLNNGKTTAAQLIELNQLNRELKENYFSHAYSVKDEKADDWTLARKQRMIQKVERLKQFMMPGNDQELRADAHYVYYEHVFTWGANTHERIAFLDDALKQFGNTRKKGFFAKEKEKILQPKLSVEVDEYAEPGHDFKVVINHYNVSEASIVIYRVETDPWNLIRANDLKDGEKMWERDVTLHKDIVLEKDTILCNLPAGQYRIYAKNEKSDKETSSTLFRVGSFKTVFIHLPDQRVCVQVFDYRSGKPVEGCTVKMRATKWDYDRKKDIVKNADATTDSYGRAYFTPEDDYHIAFIATDDKDNVSHVTGTGYDMYKEGVEPQTTLKAQLYTDRSIYRPGQKVNVTAWVFNQLKNDVAAQQDANCEFVLFNANHKPIDTLSVRTNAFGTCATEFTLPEGELNGLYSIQVKVAAPNSPGLNRSLASTSFRVEEYKRPTFQTGFESYEQTYHFGDTIEATGWAKMFSGVPVQNASVKFKIEASKSSYWYYSDSNWKTFGQGEVTTDEEGKFHIPLFFDPSVRNADDDTSERYIFRIKAEVTHLSGEMQEASTSFPVSINELSLHIDLPSVICKDTPKDIIAKAYSPKGGEQTVEGTWTIFRDGNGKEEKVQLQNGAFKTGQPMDINFAGLPAGGYYRLHLEATDSQGKKVEYSTGKIIIYSDKSDEIDVPTDWFFASDDTFGPGHDGRILYAPAKEGDIFLSCYLLTKDKLIRQTTEQTTSKIHRFTIPYKEEYGDAVQLILFYVSNGEVKTQSKLITKQLPDKKLTLEWTTFRDKLRPGQEEQWTLHIKDKDGKPARAELLSTLYDASLDKIYHHGWWFSHRFSLDTRAFELNYASHRSYNSFSLNRLPSVNVDGSDLDYDRSFSQFTFLSESGTDVSPFYDVTRNWTFSGFWFGSPLAINRLGSAAGGRVLMRKSVRVDEAVAKYDMAPTALMAEASDNGLEEEDSQKKENADNEAQQPEVEMRGNFSETAFFLPQLQTDKNGDVRIKFTLPESLTRWKFMGMAHTEGMDYGSITAYTEAKKDFMVQPNMPRFLRVGDQARLASLVINQTDKAMTGTARLRILDAQTEEELLNTTQPFSLQPNQTGQVLFNVPATFNGEYHPMLICELTGTNGSFSDGERHYLPVLDSRQHVIETAPFWLEQGTKQVDISHLFNHNSPTATDRKLTFDYTDSPAWTVIQSITMLKTPTEDDAYDYAASLYTNLVASMFNDRIPTLQKVVQAWKNDGDLKSALYENEELKTMAMKETPWLYYADKETEQRQQLVELFDTDLLRRRTALAIAKLSQLQKNDGGWPWFHGMTSSPWVTMTIAEQLASLHKMGILPNDMKGRMNKALDYLEKEMVSNYHAKLKYDKNPEPSEFDLHLLYAAAITAHKGNSEVEKIKSYYLDKVEKTPGDLSVYGWAKVAVLLDACQRHNAGLRFMESIREYSITTPGMGRHYNTGRAQYSWRDYKLPTQIAAMKAINAYRQDYADADEYYNDMLVWLIRQKETQMWDNALNTVDAVDVILNASDPDAVLHEPQRPVVTLDGASFDLGKMKEGVGYFKTIIPDDIVSQAFSDGQASVSVEKTSPGMSWGCVYSRFVENVDRLEAAGKELTVTRRYLVEEADGQLRDLQEGDAINVGQKVTVRLTVSSERDMDFVQLRCQRAACFEPKEQLSGYRVQNGQGFYQSVHDATTDYFFYVFRKGTCTIDLPLVVARSGEYIDGMATVQCAYAPAYAGHSAGGHITIQ